MAGKRISRREFLLGGGLALGTSAAAGCGLGRGRPTEAVPALATSAEPPGSARRVMRLAHLTDMHVLPSGPSQDGLARALRHAQALSPRPDVVFNTGDCIMDGLASDRQSALAQWRAFLDVFEAECSLPVRHCIGNHDVWGWDYAAADYTSDPLFGRAMAVQQLGLPGPYYSFDEAGWHFIVLDSTHPPILSGTGIPYTGQLDEEQFAWLEGELGQVPASTPVCLLSHIPILCACEFFDGPNETSGNWVVPGAWMHIDARRFRSLFLAHPNVRLCLSGHAHQVDRVDYLGVSYVCSGAVSGNWWNGSYLDFPPGYMVVDLFDDGSAGQRFIAYDSA